MKRVMLKADLHVHSKYSKRPSEWVLRKIGCAESYTEPLRLYELAKKRGMDLVTITDHNTLAGSLEIAHLEDTFLSEEITAYFPEDRCKIHILAHDIDEAGHREITRLRENVYDLVAFLKSEQIAHAVAHPLYSVNERLTIDHVEQLLVMFKTFEINGSRDEYQNRILGEILDHLTPDAIMRLADKHGLEPTGPKSWEKNLIGGSDDHSSVNIATNYTEVLGALTKDEFFAGVSRGGASVSGLASSPKTLGHNLYSIAYQFYNQKFGLDRHLGKELLFRFADRALIPDSQASEDGFFHRLRNAVGYRKSSRSDTTSSKAIQEMLQKEARDIILKNPAMRSLLEKTGHRPGEMEDAWFLFVDKISEKILSQFADSIMDSFSGANIFNIFHIIGSAGSLYTMLAPYFVSYTVFTKDRNFCARCADGILEKKESERIENIRMAHFTDTFYDINGVALNLRMQVDTALRVGKDLTVITCGPEKDTKPGVKNFEPIGTFDMPEYPIMKLYYPPLLKMLHYCYENNFTHIHAATPGPIGLAALAIARILKLPVYSTYHTALPQYVNDLTDDPSLEEMTWKYLSWFYGYMDTVYVPSRAVAHELAKKGVAREKIRVYPRGADIERFHPSKRNGFFKKNYGLGDEIVKLLYVGRVSKEKSMPLLAGACKKLAAKQPGLHLVVVGDGPYLETMKSDLEGLPVSFTGFLGGEDLAQAYASSDVFVFPSTTDTFGNVVLEAQASGVPVIVTDQGGPGENLAPGKTGLVVPGNNEDAFVDAVLDMTRNPGQLREMKMNARKYVEDRSFEAAFLSLWDSYRFNNGSENKVDFPLDDMPAGNTEENTNQHLRLVTP